MPNAFNQTVVKRKIFTYNICLRNGFFFIAENISLAASYPDACTAYLIYLTVPVTSDGLTKEEARCKKNRGGTFQAFLLPKYSDL